MTEIVPTFLDLATQSGWASRGLDGVIRYGSFRLGDYGANFGAFFDDFVGKLDSVIGPLGSTYIVYELPFLGDKMHQVTGTKLLGLASFTEWWCWRHDPRIRCAQETSISTRGHFVPGALGVKLPKKEKREYLKRVVLERCRALGWTPANDDEGDALAGLDLTLHRLKLGRPSPPPGGLFHPGDTP